MPPMVEAKMIARIMQQIMIMIFFCSSRQGKKKHVRSSITVQSWKGRKTKVDLDTEEDVKGKAHGSGF